MCVMGGGILNYKAKFTSYHRFVVNESLKNSILSPFIKFICALTNIDILIRKKSSFHCSSDNCQCNSPLVAAIRDLILVAESGVSALHELRATVLSSVQGGC